MEAAKHMIYVVDDDDAVRDSMRALLESCDFEVRDFSSAKEFLAARAESHGDCLVLDLHMPVTGGIELLAKMKAEGSRLPAIIMTGRSDAAIKQRAAQSGAFALFDKPVSEHALLDAIGRAIASGVPALTSQGEPPARKQ